MAHLNKRNTTFLLVVVIVLVAQSCYYDTEEELYPLEFCDTLSTVTYANTVESIIQNNCAVSGCHTGNSPTAGLFLDTYAQIFTIADNGQLTDRTIVQQTMPPSAPLSNCDMEAIQKWVNAGSPEE